MKPLHPSFTKRGFRKWLEAQTVGGYVGRAKKSYHCPLANFARTLYGSGVSVGTVLIPPGVSNDDAFSDLPEWALDFMTAVDRDYRKAPDVTRERALELLDAV